MADQTEMEKMAREIGTTIGSALPKGIGFALLVFDFGDGGHLAWISNAQRDDMMIALGEFMQKNAH